ncbi:hypothetical protein BS17DRAFT_785509 [Gyrodon lividus]|nr:hypothetical protein BS17DRAFT_785509 [Gyrodon lividus]
MLPLALQAGTHPNPSSQPRTIHEVRFVHCHHAHSPPEIRVVKDGPGIWQLQLL